MKTEKQHSIDELFRSKLENAEMEQSTSSWKLLEYLIKEQKHKRKLIFVRSFFIATFAIMLGLFLMNKETIFNQQDTPLVNENNRLIGVNAEENSQKSNIESPVSNRQSAIGNGQSPISNQQSLISNQQSAISNEQSPIGNRQSAMSNQQSAIGNEQSSTSNIKPQTSNLEHQTSNSNSETYINSTATTAYLAKEDEEQIIIESLGKDLNSSYAEYAPVINADGSELFFTSRRPTTEKDLKKGKSGQENIFYTKFNKAQQDWKEAVLLPDPINNKTRFSSAVALSNDGQRLFVYRDDKYGDGDIFESVLKGTVWSEPQPLPEPINSKYLETTVSLASDGNTMYFVSNRPGGVGSLDIWYCTKDKAGKWGEAKNMGNIINTPTEEEGVFIHPDGKTLYFSSRGHKGEGGYDIFMTQKGDNNTWTTPVNLGNKINTPNDDVYFVVEANGKYAYYASERKDGKGEKDLYKITFVANDKKENTAQLTLFKGNVLDKAEKFPLGAEIEILDLEKNEPITTLSTNTATGAFMIALPAGKNYAINVQKKGYLFYSENFNIPAREEYKEVNTTILLDKLKAGAKVVMKNIFYDYDKATLRTESKTELDKIYELILQNPTLKIELSAHTDSRGSDTYNLQLSQNRAQSCVDYLISKGINKTQIIAKGYGEQQLVIGEKEIEKMTSEQEQENAHQQNRRSEIKIMEN